LLELVYREGQVESAYDAMFFTSRRFTETQSTSVPSTRQLYSHWLVL